MPALLHRPPVNRVAQQEYQLEWRICPSGTRSQYLALVHRQQIACRTAAREHLPPGAGCVVHAVPVAWQRAVVTATPQHCRVLPQPLGGRCLLQPTAVALAEPRNVPFETTEPRSDVAGFALADRRTNGAGEQQQQQRQRWRRRQRRLLSLRCLPQRCQALPLLLLRACHPAAASTQRTHLASAKRETERRDAPCGRENWNPRADPCARPPRYFFETPRY
eukprot:358188-Chlamydomonas_euryale.AAC.3